MVRLYFINNIMHITWSRDSAVGIEAGYGLDGRGFGVRVPTVARFFSSPRRPDRFWRPATLYRMGTEGFFSGGKTARARS
jgi:hypothetical protein